MGRYQEIVDLIEQSAPDFTNLKIVPRGTPIFSDPLMDGETRFARKTGANFAVLNPDNEFELAQPAQPQQQVLNVDRVLPWFEMGALVTFNKTEMLQVENWDEANNAVFIDTPLSAPRPAGTRVALWATPIVVHFDTPANVTQIFVRSRYQLVNGDAITLPVAESINSLLEFDVETASYAGNDLDPEYPFIYVLNLTRPVPIALSAGISRIFIRAFPAYVSRSLRIPQLTSGQIGPFLLDFVSSPLDAIPSYPETFSIRTFTNSDVVIEGSTTTMKTVPHNHPIYNRPIWADSMIFWTIKRGFGGFVLPNRYRMVVSSELGNGDFAARVSTELVPPMPTGLTYQFRVKANAQGQFITIPYPYAETITTVPISTDTLITFVTPPNGAPITRLDFIFKCATEGAEITISDIQIPTDPVVERFQYGYVFRVIGATNFQATSIICKPYFLSLADLKANYDEDKTHNSGFIYL
jgi:hypothetical protein